MKPRTIILRLLVLAALLYVVTGFALQVWQGVSSGWAEIRQRSNQRDMRFLAKALDESGLAAEAAGTEHPAGAVNRAMKGEKRLWGPPDWSLDPWGGTYRFALSNGDLVIDCAGPDGVIGTDDDSQFRRRLSRRPTSNP